jgi:hypothetical protein
MSILRQQLHLKTASLAKLKDDTDTDKMVVYGSLKSWSFLLNWLRKNLYSPRVVYRKIVLKVEF